MVRVRLQVGVVERWEGGYRPGWRWGRLVGWEELAGQTVVIDGGGGGGGEFGGGRKIAGCGLGWEHVTG